MNTVHLRLTPNCLIGMPEMYIRYIREKDKFVTHMCITLEIGSIFHDAYIQQQHVSLSFLLSIVEISLQVNDSTHMYIFYNQSEGLIN